MCVLYSLLLLVLALCQMVQATSFPSAADATVADQERWGAYSRGYVLDGCYHGTSATTSVSMPQCRAFALETSAPASLQGFETMTAQQITYSAGDGLYWLGGRANVGVAMAGWTCRPGEHYCWIKQDTPPAVPSGLVLLGKTTLSAGAISAFVIMAPWRRTTPYAIPGGQTLLFGVCPEAGPYQIFAGPGVARFAPGACRMLVPEWWGIDPTGLTDSTALWPLVFSAATSTGAGHSLTPIACSGTYLISSQAADPVTTPAAALTLPINTQLVGSFRPAGGGDTQMPCRLNYVGNSQALSIPEGTRVRLENLQVLDVEATGTHGILSQSLTAAEIRNVMIRQFDFGFQAGPGIYYTRIEQLRVFGSRIIPVDLPGVINDAFIDVQINTAFGAASNTTLTHGLRIGQTPGLFGQSNNVRLNALVEVHRGIPVSIGRVAAIDARLYVEHAAGQVEDFSAIGAIHLFIINGGRVHIRATGNAQGGNPPVGLRIIGAAEGDAVGHTRNVVFTGQIMNYVAPYQTVLEAGGWGLDFSGLHVEDPHTATDASFVSGQRLGKSYLSYGPAPGVDQGRASTAEGTNWQVGDLLFGTPEADGRIGSILRQVTVAGNPPTVKEIAFVSHDTITFVDGDATPTIRQGNTYLTRVLVAAGTTDITDIDDERNGQCVWMRATGGRTILDNANFVFKSAGNKVLAANDTLQLCNDGGVWYEY